MNIGGCFHYRVWSSSVANVFPSKRSSSSRSICLVRAAYKRDLDCTSSPGDPSLRGFIVAELTPLARFLFSKIMRVVCFTVRLSVGIRPQSCTILSEDIIQPVKLYELSDGQASIRESRISRSNCIQSWS
jgi:hypothetical protein